MAFVLEVSLKANHVLFVFRIRQIDLLKNLNFLQTSFSPAKGYSSFLGDWGKILHCLIVSDKFDSNQLLRRHIHGSNDPRKHTFSEVCLNMISSIQQFT